MTYRGRNAARRARKEAVKAAEREIIRKQSEERAWSRYIAKEPRPVDGMRYVDRVNDLPGFDRGPDNDNLTAPYRRQVWLSAIVGGDRPVPRRFAIRYSDPIDLASLNFAQPWNRESRTIEFTWRQWALNAGDTSIRWLTPEPIRQGAGDPEAFQAARKAVAMILRARQECEWFTYYQRDPNMAKQVLDIAFDAIQEWMGMSGRAIEEAA